MRLHQNAESIRPHQKGEINEISFLSFSAIHFPLFAPRAALILFLNQKQARLQISTGWKSKSRDSQRPAKKENVSEIFLARQKFQNKRNNQKEA